MGRVSDGKWFAGVAAGLARSLGVDPLVVRAAFILFGIFFGMGVALYLVLWLLLPAEDGSISLERALRYGDGGSIFLLIITVLSLFGGGGAGWRSDWAGLRIVGLIAVGAVLWWIYVRHPRGPGSPSSPTNWGPGSATGQGFTPPGATTAPGAAAGQAGPEETVASGAASATGRPGSPTSPARGAHVPSRPAAAYPVPPRPVTPGLGFATGAIILGAALVVGALTTTAADRAGWSGNHVSLGMAAALAVIGLGALGAGLAGRRSGWIAPFAIVGIIATLISSVSPVGLHEPWRVGDRSWAPTTIQGAGPYELGTGNLRLDLSNAVLDSDPTTVQTIHASVGMGELRLTVPDNVAVRVETAVRVGGLTARNSAESPDGAIDAGGVDFRRTVDYGQGTAQLVVDAEVGLGHITIDRG